MTSMRWVLLMALACVCGAASEAEIPYSELSALFALKAVLTLDPSGEVWRTWIGLPCDESPWVGVECEKQLDPSVGRMQKHVVSLDLPALALESRALPEELGDLTKLRMLRLGRDWGNSFRGALPSSLQRLTNLQYLLLGGNDITSIPSDWSSLTQLRVVELSGNSRLAGTLPVSLFDLPKLHTLRIQGTQMHGPLPPIGGAPLTELRLGHNELSGMLPSSLALLTGLTDLGLEGNRLHGPLPEEVFGSMPRLAELNLSSQFSRSGFTGTLPAALWTMSDLRVLDLHSNSLEGPLGIRDKSDDDSLQSLSVLNLASNRLTGPLPSHLASLPMLQYVYLNDNNLNGNVDPILCGGSASLRFVYLTNNQLCSSQPALVTNAAMKVDSRQCPSKPFYVSGVPFAVCSTTPPTPLVKQKQRTSVPVRTSVPIPAKAPNPPPLPDLPDLPPPPPPAPPPAPPPSPVETTTRTKRNGLRRP